MKKLILILLCLLLCTPALAARRGGVATCTDANPAGSCAGFLVCQNFETCVDVAPLGLGEQWTLDGETWFIDADVGGAATPNYVTNPLRGVQSFYLRDPDVEADMGSIGVRMFGDATGINEWYAFFRLKVLNRPDSGDYELFRSSNVLAPVENGDWLLHLGVNIASTGELILRSMWADEEDHGDTVLALNTVYYVWLYCIHDATHISGWMKVSTSPSMPSSNDAVITNAAYTDVSRKGCNAIQFSTQHGYDYEYVVDQVLVKTTAIGNVCP